MSWPFGDLRPLSYRAILVDPPWRYKMRSDKGRAKSPDAHYSCMDMDALKALPVDHLAAGDCAMIMWTVFPFLAQSLELLETWGFCYKTGGAWAKQSRTGKHWAFGTGYHLRSAAEPFLIGTIGNPDICSRSMRNLIVAPVQEHSRKPDDIYTIVEALYEGPYCELFARQRRPGWDSWGYETDKFEGAA